MLIVDEALRGSSFGRGPRTPLPLRRRPGGTERREIRKEGVTKTNCDGAVTPGAYGRVHRSEPTKTGGGARPSRRAGVGGEEGGEPVEGAPSRGSNPGTSEEAAARRRTGVHRRECGGSLATHREPGGAGAEAPGKEERAGPAPRGSGQPQPRKSEGGVTSRRGLETDYRDRGALPCRAPDRERPESSRNRAHEESGDRHLGAEGGCAGQQPTGGAKNARRARRESARLEPPVRTQVAHQGGGVVEPASIASRGERDRGEAQSGGRSVPDRAESEERVDEEEERHKDRRCTQLASDCQSCQHRGGDEVTAHSPRRGGAAERPVPKEKKKKGRQQQKRKRARSHGRAKRHGWCVERG